MESEPISVPSKAKYRLQKTVIKNGSYRTRTGPNCCNGGCGSQKKKSKKHTTKKNK